MPEWRECRLDDLGVVVGGGTPCRERAAYWDGPISWLTPSELTANSQKCILDTQDGISDFGLITSGAKLLPEGSLLMTSRASIGSCALAGRPMATNQGFKNLVPSAKIDSSYLFYLGRTLGREMTRRSSGTTFLEISGREFGRIEIRLPPLEEQRRIAEILDTIDEAIQATERVIAKLVVTGRALLTALVEQSTSCGESVSLSCTGSWLSGGTPSTSESSFWGGPIPWITASSIRGKYLSHSTRTLTTSGVASGSRLVPPGTLICVVRGMSLKNEFRVGIAEVDVAFGQDCKALSPSEDWLPEFLYLQLVARESKILKLVDEASHGTGRLQMSLLGSVSIDCVPLPEQHRLVTIFRAHEQRVATEQDALAKLRQTRAGLSADLLSGRVRTVAP